MQRNRQLLLMVKHVPILDTEFMQKGTKHSIINITAKVMDVVTFQVLGHNQHKHKHCIPDFRFPAPRNLL